MLVDIIFKKLSYDKDKCSKNIFYKLLYVYRKYSLSKEVRNVSNTYNFYDLLIEFVELSDRMIKMGVTIPSIEHGKIGIVNKYKHKILNIYYENGNKINLKVVEDTIKRIDTSFYGAGKHYKGKSFYFFDMVESTNNISLETRMIRDASEKIVRKVIYKAMLEIIEHL